MSQTKLYLTDDLIDFLGVQDAVSGSDINNAQVFVTLVDRDTGDEIDGETWPLALAAVGSGGDYRAVLTRDLVVVKGQALLAQLTVDGGTGKHRYWEIDVIVKVGSN